MSDLSAGLSPERLLIEDWLPVKELGIESRRERGAASALPPLSFLHVWWARRPLVASAGVVLGGLLPAWSKELAEAFPESKQVQSEAAYRSWFLHLVGIWGDPVQGRKNIDAANAEGRKLDGNGYGYRQAFRNHPSNADIALLHVILVATWGEVPIVADPTAGGGSIPFVAARLGLPTVANDLNSISAGILEAGVRIPATYGSDLVPHLKKWGDTLCSRVEERVASYFPLEASNGVNESVIAYIWANAVACPRTGRLVPLVGDWWLRKTPGKEVWVKLHTEDAGVELDEPRFEVVASAPPPGVDPSKGIMSRGAAISPYDHLLVDSDYIKAEAQAGRMSNVLYAIAVRLPDGSRSFRAPTSTDLDAVSSARMALESVRAKWEVQNFLPTEDFPIGNDMRPLRYGMTTWADFFTERQLLVHGTFAVELHDLSEEVRKQEAPDLADAILVELALMQGKALNYNSRLSSWHVSKQVMRSVFERHDFAFKWTFAEFEGAHALYRWCLDQLVDAYGGIAGLLDDTGRDLATGERLRRSVQVSQGNAADLQGIADGTVAHVSMDPPYYDNVMYAELADYFYVWEKRTLGRVLPHFFHDELTDKENEAVANPARFADMGKRKKELADADYEAKMTAIFAECRRIMRDDGVLSVMFTHKRAEAWDTLGMGLLNAGFIIDTSWPVNSESEHSLHQANLNAASSTIMLVCRKRVLETRGDVFFEDIESEVRQAARDAVARFEEWGLSGIDLLLSTYGPALSVISKNWPVYSSHVDESGRARLLRPEEALDAARSEVSRLVLRRVVGSDVQFDAYTDFVLIAWSQFESDAFEYDLARRLALLTGGLDMSDLEAARLVESKSAVARLREPNERVLRGEADGRFGVSPTANEFENVIDAVHTAAYVADVDGLGAAKAFLDRLGLTKDARFNACVQGLVNSIPRTQVKGEWVYPLAETLDRLVAAYLPSITIPADVVTPTADQGDLFADAE